MNATMVKRLVLKDWYFERYALISALAGGALSLWLIGFGSEEAFYIGSILLITILISIGVQLAFATVINERTQHTLPFVMSLPISPADYTMAKILANMLIFLVPWIILVAGCWAVISVTEIPDGLIPFAAGYCLTLAVALISETQGWTVAALIFSNLFIQYFMYAVSHIPAIARDMQGSAAVWSQPAVLVLLVELLAIGLMLGVTFYLQGRKRDFV